MGVPQNGCFIRVPPFMETPYMSTQNKRPVTPSLCANRGVHHTLEEFVGEGPTPLQNAMAPPRLQPFWFHIFLGIL